MIAIEIARSRANLSGGGGHMQQVGVECCVEVRGSRTLHHMITVEIVRSRVNLSLSGRSKINATVAVSTGKHNYWLGWSSALPARWQAR